jgi:hypothetical protein
VSQVVAGSAPMKQNRPRHACSVVSPVAVLVRVMRFSDEAPASAVTSVDSAIVMRGSVLRRLMSYVDKPALRWELLTARVTLLARAAR